jgi:hypothetical protein
VPVTVTAAVAALRSRGGCRPPLQLPRACPCRPRRRRRRRRAAAAAAAPHTHTRLTCTPSTCFTSPTPLRRRAPRRQPRGRRRRLQGGALDSARPRGKLLGSVAVGWVLGAVFGISLDKARPAGHH